VERVRRELSPAALRDIADWLDTYDRLAAAHFDLLERLEEADAETLAPARVVAAGEEVQADLRRWADDMEASRLG
jgi:hypothetical protein